MPEDKRIADGLRNLLPRLSTLDKERLLMYGEGMAVKAEDYRRAQATETAPQRAQT